MKRKNSIYLKYNFLEHTWLMKCILAEYVYWENVLTPKILNSSVFIINIITSFDSYLILTFYRFNKAKAKTFQGLA